MILKQIVVHAVIIWLDQSLVNIKSQFLDECTSGELLLYIKLESDHDPTTQVSIPVIISFVVYFTTLICKQHAPLCKTDHHL